MRPTGNQAIEAYMPFWAKGKGMGVWDHKGMEDTFIGCHAESMGHREVLDLQVLPTFPPAYHNQALILCSYLWW